MFSGWERCNPSSIILFPNQPDPSVQVPSGQFPEDDLKQFLMQFVADGTISKYAIPDRVIAAEEIPKTSVGKLDKKLIRQNV